MHLLLSNDDGYQSSGLTCLAEVLARRAEVTVVDISPAMLELDREVAAERNFSIRTVEASMDQMPMLADGEFDIVIHPVSTCYVPDLRKVYGEIARVTKPGGYYISQHKQPVSLQSSPMLWHKAARLSSRQLARSRTARRSGSSLVAKAST